MRMEMLLSASRMRRSFSWRAPTMSPSRPTSGLVDASKTTAMVGSSISMGSRRTGVLAAGDHVADVGVVHAHHGHDVARVHFVLFLLAQLLEREHVLDGGVVARAVVLDDQRLLVLVDGAR